MNAQIQEVVNNTNIVENTAGLVKIGDVVVQFNGRPEYIHSQDLALDIWIIIHNLNRHPGVIVIDSAGSECKGAIIYNSANQLTINFSAPFGGKAFLI